MFKITTPEEAGISSNSVLSFLKTLEDYRFVTHSVLMAHGDAIITECYYEPFSESFNHRMYSISKSFMAVAIGLAYTEGLLKLDDKLCKFFPEYQGEFSDELFEETTISDMLTMRSNVNTYVNWWGEFSDRIASYYKNRSGQYPGTLFYYDSVGSSLLGVIIEKLTGKNFLEYLKEKVLCEIGFSESSYVLYAVGGNAFGDSGVICTARDLLIFARLVMNLGSYNGKQYIDKDFMQRAISKQSDNDTDGSFRSYAKYGYGYLIWKAPNDGFAFLGMGDQLAICDVKHDFIFIMTADNQADNTTSRAIIYNELYKGIINSIQSKPLPEDKKAYDELMDYISRQKLVCAQGDAHSNYEHYINGVKYRLKDNPMGIASFTVRILDKKGCFEFERNGKLRRLDFGLSGNLVTKFPDDMRNFGVAGETDEGQYDCAASGAWHNSNTLMIKAQIIDTYFGCLNVYLCFIDSRVTMLMKKSGQYVLDNFEGYAMGTAETDKR